MTNRTSGTSPQQRGNAQEAIHPLDRHQPRDQRDHRGILGQSELGAQRRSPLRAGRVGDQKGREVEPERHHGKALTRRHAELGELVADLLGHRDQPVGTAREEALDLQEERVAPAGEVAAERVTVEGVDEDGPPAGPEGEQDGEPPERPCLRRVRVHDARLPGTERAHQGAQGDEIVRAGIPLQRGDPHRAHPQVGGQVVHVPLVGGFAAADQRRVVAQRRQALRQRDRLDRRPSDVQPRDDPDQPDRRRVRAPVRAHPSASGP